MVKRCQNRKTVVFLPLIATSQKFCAILNSKGFKATEVNGTSEDRSDIIESFSRGDYNVICNSMLLTEGWDCPSVDCVIVLRATKSRGLYCQMVGRGTRLSPETGKKNLLLLDFLWNVERHELCRPAHLISDSPEVQEKMTDKLEELAREDSEEEVDLELLEKEASLDVIQEREERLAEELRLQRAKKAKLVDPLQYEMSIEDEALANYVPAFGWESGPMTEKQIDLLEKAGINSDSVGCAGKASLLLNRIEKRRDLGLSTPKQIRLLERYGFKYVGQWTKTESSDMISRISENRWRVPKNVNPSDYRPQSLTKQQEVDDYDW
jgi:type I site-specific restriction endonuclease